MKKISLISLLLALALPVIPTFAYAQNWVTPSGAVVNDQGQLVSAPPAATTTPFTVKVSVKHSTYESKVLPKTHYIF